MKKNCTLLVMIVFAKFLFAQTTAVNFIKNNCNTGLKHNLFEELDSGMVIVMDFIMLPNCTPCISASNRIEPIVNSYSSSFPGKVRFYSIGYNDIYTCPEMLTWAGTYGIGSTLFIQGNSEVTYYGGMGMPTIVVVGNPTHSVYHNQIGFSDADTIAIRSAIDSALAVTYINEVHSDNSLSVFPIPASDKIKIYSKDNEPVSRIEVFDSYGKFLFAEGGKNEISISQISPGTYFLRIISQEEKTIGIKSVIKK